MDLVNGILHRAELYEKLKDGRNTGLTPQIPPFDRRQSLEYDHIFKINFFIYSIPFKNILQR